MVRGLFYKVKSMTYQIKRHNAYTFKLSNILQVNALIFPFFFLEINNPYFASSGEAELPQNTSLWPLELLQ